MLTCCLMVVTIFPYCVKTIGYRLNFRSTLYIFACAKKLSPLFFKKLHDMSLGIWVELGPEVTLDKLASSLR